MTKIRILIVTNSFYPMISARSLRATELSCELARQGHEVTIISREPDDEIQHFLRENRLRFRSYGRLSLKEIKIKDDNSNQIIRRSVRRLLLMLFEYPNIEIMWRVKKQLKNTEDTDLMISIASPHAIHWGVAWAITKNRNLAKTWIADCGDPFMGARTDSFRKLFYFKYLEKWFCRKANYISVPIEEARRAYYPEFDSKIRVIPQGFDFSNIKRAIYIKSNKYPTFAYAGSLTQYIDSGPRFFKYLIDLPINFKFIMYINKTGWLQPYLEHLGDRIEIKNYIQREQLIYELSKSDFLISFMYKTDVQKTSKLINYLLTGRPILNISPTTDLSIFMEFVDGNFENQFIEKDIEQYNIRNVAQKFVSVHNKIK